MYNCNWIWWENVIDAIAIYAVEIDAIYLILLYYIIVLTTYECFVQIMFHFT